MTDVAPERQICPTCKGDGSAQRPFDGNCSNMAHGLVSAAPSSNLQRLPPRSDDERANGPDATWRCRLCDWQVIDGEGVTKPRACCPEGLRFDLDHGLTPDGLGQWREVDNKSWVRPELTGHCEACKRMWRVQCDSRTDVTVTAFHCACGHTTKMGGASGHETRAYVPTNVDLQRGANVLWSRQFKGTPWEGKVQLINPDSMEEYRALALQVWKAVGEYQSALKASEQLYRLRPLCLCSGHSSEASLSGWGPNPACPIHGNAQNGKPNAAKARTCDWPDTHVQPCDCSVNAGKP